MDSASIEERTTVATFYRQAARLGDRPLIHHHDGGHWLPSSWTEVAEQARRLAARLVEEGVQPGDRVLLMSQNCVEWLYADLGIQSAGAVTVPIYPSSPAKQAQAIAANSGAVLAIVADDETATRLALAAPLRKVVRIKGELAGWLKQRPSAAKEKELDRRLRNLKPGDLATIVYTSGTTGEPKGVMLTHANVADMAVACLKVFPLGEDDVALSFLPFAHIFERVSGLAVALHAGSSAYLARSVDKLVEDIRDVRPTVMTSVPRVYEKMYAGVMAEVAKAPAWKRALFSWAVGQGRRGGRLQPLAERLVLRPLRIRLTGGRLRFFVSGGAPLAKEVEEFFWALGVQILQGWGLTETASGVTSNTPTQHRFESVGRPLPGIELKIAEDGEVLVKGPGNMLGYYRNAEATAEILKGGWLYTGDVGEIDEAGFLKITDRKKDLIKTAGGKYVAPQPIEARLQEDPLIERAVVVGDQKPYVTALIVPDWEAMRSKLGLSGDPGQLTRDQKAIAAVQRRVDAVNSDLGSWESIKYFRLLAEDFNESRGEITPTLKVKRKVVQESYQEQIESMYGGKPRPRRKDS